MLLTLAVVIAAMGADILGLVFLFFLFFKKDNAQKSKYRQHNRKDNQQVGHVVSVLKLVLSTVMIETLSPVMGCTGPRVPFLARDIESHNPLPLSVGARPVGLKEVPPPIHPWPFES